MLFQERNTTAAMTDRIIIDPDPGLVDRIAHIQTFGADANLRALRAGLEDVWIARMDRTLHPDEDQ